MLSLFDIKKILSPSRDYMPEDDFRIIQSWAEYDDSSSKTPEERNLDYLCYELEVMNPDTGERTHFYKAIKMARVIRLPANAKQSTAFMDMQEQVLAGVHEQNYNLITIIANIIRPVALAPLLIEPSSFTVETVTVYRLPSATGTSTRAEVASAATVCS